VTGNEGTFHNWCPAFRIDIVPAVKDSAKELINYIGKMVVWQYIISVHRKK
jgi:hypothetical protein